MQTVLDQFFDKDVFVRLYLNKTAEAEAVQWGRALTNEKLLTAHNRRLIARKREGLKSLLRGASPSKPRMIKRQKR